METQNTRHDPKVLNLLIRCLKQIADKTEFKDVAGMLKEVIKAEVDADFICLIHGLCDKAPRVEELGLRRKKGRAMNECIRNAVKEEKETRNTRRWGWLTTHTHGRHMMVVRHAFNRDRKTGEYYDTQDLPEWVSFDALVSVSDEDFEEMTKGYDYYYIKFNDVVFRFRREFGAEITSDFTLECKIKRVGGMLVVLSLLPEGQTMSKV